MSLVEMPENQIPEGAVCDFVTTSDGMRIRFARWPARMPGSKGTVCVFGGRSEFIEKYFEVIEQLLGRGFAVAAMDWRGQGRSDRLLADPRKGHVDSFDDYNLDLAAFMTKAVLPDCPPPYFGLAHSMGGNILMRHATKHANWFDRMVLCAPMVWLTRGRGLPLAVKLRIVELLCYLGHADQYISGGGATATNSVPFLGNPFTSDKERHALYDKLILVAPDLGLGSPTYGWVTEAERAMRTTRDPDFPPKVHVPVMVLAAGADRIVSTPAIEAVMHHMRAGGHVVLPGAQHEIMMERDEIRAQFWAVFDAFVPGDPVYD